MRFPLPHLGPVLAGLALSVSPLAVSAASAEPVVITSIKPVHSLVAAVMEGVGEPELLVDGASSPHGYQLKPSQAGELQKADLVFWVGPELESFLVKPVETIASSAQSVPLIDAAGVTKLEPREGGTFEHHDHHHEGEAHDAHDDDGHEDAEKAHERHEGESEEAHAHEHEGAHEEAHEHGHEEVDPHVWLDPENAKAFVDKIVSVLSAADPANAETYAANGEAEDRKLDELIEAVNTTLDPVRDRSFIVFHDAYHYFENRFGMEAAGSITINPELRPGAERIGEIQTKLKSLKAACVFAEPQFEPKIVSVAIEGSDARSGVLDPVGADLAPGPDLYGKLIGNLATSMRDCLADNS
ncbi:MAG: zinc ABC transporter substrate-binding protein [Rhizobiales bacterium]|nr:zinc ABC transporter substrate-binding protein [Hyphomicrobiales bacterium]MBA70965.1 zinc ABC transporter substrate-binding protein [Hyphomicrobiales bacterium]|tara:strand:+ start:443 stop:1510 length:1068 start_codon:yes stop_codon:yes gene_type:complete